MLKDEILLARRANPEATEVVVPADRCCELVEIAKNAWKDFGSDGDPPKALLTIFGLDILIGMTGNLVVR